MRAASKLFALSAPLLASAAPLYRRAPTATDVLVLQFAHTLEKLEQTFYEAAIAKYKPEDFTAAGYLNVPVAVEQLQLIAKDEAAHDSVLTQALRDFNVEPLQCQFNLDAGLTDVVTTMTIARKVEVVGVAAYMGAANLVSDKRILNAAASILTIEARHSTVLHMLNGAVTAPSPFDFPLAPEQVLAIAGGFITGCDLGIKGNTPLTVTNQGLIGPGTRLTFSSQAIDAAGGGAGLFCHILLPGAAISAPLPIDACDVPAGASGPFAVYLLNDNQPILALDILDQSKTNIVAGPDIVMADLGTPAQAISQVLLSADSKLIKDLSGSGSAPVQNSSTNTIGVPEANASVTSAGGQNPINAATAPAPGPTGNIFLGDIIPKMPAPGAGEGAPATTPAADSAGIPLPTGVDSASVPLATDPAAVPPPPAGGAVSSGDIAPIVGGEAPVAGADIVPAPPVRRAYPIRRV